MTIDFMSLIRVAVNSLVRNKSRSVLTTLGIVIGVAAVIVLVAIGTGLQGYVTRQFESLGANTIYVMPFKATDSEGRFRGTGGPPSTTNKGFNQRELELVRRLGEPVTKAVPLIEKTVEVTYKGETDTKYVVASNEDYPEVRGVTVERGRWFSQVEEQRGRRVVVLGQAAAEDLFGETSPLGKAVTISVASFTVVGVMAKIGSAGIGPNIDDAVYLPLAAAQRLFDVASFDVILVKVSSTEVIVEATKLIEKEIGKVRDKDKFSVVDQSQILATITGILGAVTAGIGGIAAISLLVGGIGIMNIMLVSVTERTREIGLRKAVGATPRVILVQFLIESVVLALLGGMVGVGLGMGGSLILNRFLPTQVSWGSVMLAFGVSAGVGIVFGVLPARRAAKLSPINALRYE